MSRQAVIKIVATILVPYDRQKFGDTARAEEVANTIKADLNAKFSTCAVKSFDAKHTTVEGEP